MVRSKLDERRVPSAWRDPAFVRAGAPSVAGRLVPSILELLSRLRETLPTC